MIIRNRLFIDAPRAYIPRPTIDTIVNSQIDLLNFNVINLNNLRIALSIYVETRIEACDDSWECISHMNPIVFFVMNLELLLKRKRYRFDVRHGIITKSYHITS